MSTPHGHLCRLAFPCSTLLLLMACAASSELAEDIEVQSGEQALALLLEGNERFVAGQPRMAHEGMARRAYLAEGQHPYGIILGCADSRVPPELVFDVGLGDLFVIRVAGNVVGEDEAGSIEYAVAHLGTRLVMVLGHEGCGAVTAGFEAMQGSELKELDQLLSDIAPALAGIDPDLPQAERVHLGVEANVRQSLTRIRAIQERVGQPEPRAVVIGAIYELETGRVRLLD